jgi:hypothetical protein
MPENLQIAFILFSLFKALQDRIFAGLMPEIIKELMVVARRAKACIRINNYQISINRY